MKNIAYIDGSFNAKKDICGAVPYSLLVKELHII